MLFVTFLETRSAGIHGPVVIRRDPRNRLFKIIKNSFTVEGISIKNSSVLIILQDSINNREESISLHFPQKQSTT